VSRIVDYLNLKVGDLVRVTVATGAIYFKVVAHLGVWDKWGDYYSVWGIDASTPEEAKRRYLKAYQEKYGELYVMGESKSIVASLSVSRGACCQSFDLKNVYEVLEHCVNIIKPEKSPFTIEIVEVDK